MSGLTVTPTPVASFKKNAVVNIQFVVATGTPVLPVTWSVSGGPLPTGVTLNSATGLLSGQVPSALASGSSATITATDSTPTTPQTGTATITSCAVTDGDDPEGFHLTAESSRSNVTTFDQVRHGLAPGGSNMTPADYLLRQWPLEGGTPPQTS